MKKCPISAAKKIVENLYNLSFTRVKKNVNNLKSKKDLQIKSK
jgi:hypothetical protein